MNDLLDLAIPTQQRRENAATLRPRNCSSTFVSYTGAQYVNSAEHTVLEEYELSFRAHEALFRLQRFHELKEDWDSYGALVPKAMTILAAKQFVQAMDRKELAPYFVSPGPSGELMVEYRSEGGMEVEVHFHGDGSRLLLVTEGDAILYEGPYTEQKFLKHAARGKC